MLHITLFILSTLFGEIKFFDSLISIALNWTLYKMYQYLLIYEDIFFCKLMQLSFFLYSTFIVCFLKKTLRNILDANI